MKDKQKALLLIVCLLIFFPLARSFRKKEEMPQNSDANTSSVEIIVYNTRENVIKRINLEEYIVGVVAAEMPASFSSEALKAQAIAARTYALGRAVEKYGNTRINHFGAHVCTNPAHCQAWIPKELYQTWYPKSDVDKNWAKIEQAAYETSGLILTYDGEIINPLYHANSGGITEDVQEVWSSVNSVPYLQSVFSEGESDYSSFEKKVVFKGEEIREKLMKVYPDIVFMGSISEDMEIIQYTNSQRVKEIRVGSITVPGTKFREIFSLASTQIEINFPADDEIEIVTYGFGHGVGMSQCGANELAQKGKDYDYILKYYYTGVEIEPLSDEIVLKFGN
ncbi:MAG: stage II sporulation protein D [Clostridiaceae bacterium]|nr:stage II sporulation protein D [Clostridiaceae bacterium]